MCSVAAEMPSEGQPLGEGTEPTELREVPGSESGGVSNTDPAWAGDSGVFKGPQAVSEPEPKRQTAVVPPLARVSSLARELSSRVPARARLPAALGATALVGVLLGALVFHRSAPLSANDELVRFAKRVKAPERDLVVRSLEKSDVLSALGALRDAGAYEHLRADPIAQALRARLSLLAKDPGDALDWLEQALALDQKLCDEPWVPDAVVQTFGANKPSRTGAMLTRIPKAAALKALHEACIDSQYRIRHSAAETLKGLNDACPDPVAALIADAWQADRCDQARITVQKLLPSLGTDDRIAPVLDVLARRPGSGPCVAELLPKTGK
jgi:hypothetical protein